MTRPGPWLKVWEIGMKQGIVSPTNVKKDVRELKGIVARPHKRVSVKQMRKAVSRRAGRYEIDKGPLTREQMDAIGRLQPAGRMKGGKRLF